MTRIGTQREPRLLVVGGTQGLGLQIAREANRRTWGVIHVVGRGKPSDMGTALAFHQADLARPYMVQALADELLSQGWVPTHVVWAAAKNLITPTHKLSWEDLHSTMQLNAFSLAEFVGYLHAELNANASTVMAIGSSASDGAGRDSLAYVASKHALTGVVRSLARDYGPGITTFQVNLPKFVGTRMSDYIELKMADLRGSTVFEELDRERQGAAGRVLAEAQQLAPMLLDLLMPEPGEAPHSFLNGSIVRLGYGS